MNYDASIKRIAKNDMQALEEVYNDLYSSVFALALSIVKDTAIAADVTQETFLRVYNSASRFRSSGQGRAWILKISRNLSFDYINKLSRERPEENLEFLSNEDNSYAQSEDEITLSAVLSTLSADEREIVVLKSQGYRHREIADIVNLPEGTVRWKYSESIKKLKKENADVAI